MPPQPPTTTSGAPKKEIERIQALPAKAWKRVRVDRAGRYRNPHLHDETIRLDQIAHPVRQIAIKNMAATYPPLAITNDRDTTLTVAAANTYRLFARQLRRYERAQPERLHRDFIDADGTIHIDHDTVTVTLKPRTYTPVLLDAGYHSLDTPIPWWNHRRLRFTFPPR